MSQLWLILAMGAGVYALRLSGLLLPNVAIPVEWEQALRFLPVALLGSLVTVGLAGGGQVDPAELAGAAVGALVAWKTRRMWACIVSGLATYWLLALL
jgi:branched-subunit amino acid transport protein